MWVSVLLTKFTKDIYYLVLFSRIMFVCFLSFFFLGCEHQLDEGWDEECQQLVDTPVRDIWLISQEFQIAGYWKLSVNLTTRNCSMPYLGETILSSIIILDAYNGKIWWLSDEFEFPLEVGSWSIGTPLTLNLPINHQLTNHDSDHIMNEIRSIYLTINLVSEQQMSGVVKLYTPFNEEQSTTDYALAYQGTFILEAI